MDHPVVSREDWLAARADLLAKEKAFTRAYDALSAEQRALPWVEITKPYKFDTPSGRKTLAELFDGRSQLFVKHFMMEPGQLQQCVGCSLEVDHLDGILAHLNNHDVTWIAGARAPLAEIEALRQRMGWRFPWVSSHGSDFNDDIQGAWRPGSASFTNNSVFYRDADGRVFHTYSAYGRGGEAFLGVYRYLDVMPKGRDENGPYHSLGDWARPRNMYGQGGMVESNGRYHPSTCGCALHVPAA